MSSLRRIHIVGGPGSGKTTLARRLAVERTIPVYDLDSIGYKNGAGAKHPLSDKVADVSAIAERDAWITEGIFLWWTDELLRKADVIVWLDISWRVAAWRIVRRHAMASLSGTNRHRGLRRLWRFLLAARDRRSASSACIKDRSLPDVRRRCAFLQVCHQRRLMSARHVSNQGDSWNG
jgi:adenylate kinase family enzyme